MTFVDLRLCAPIDSGMQCWGPAPELALFGMDSQPLLLKLMGELLQTV
jgi:hypothetical protein